jgi:putative flippase GtrA
MQHFWKYVSIGVVNTAIHWSLFLIMHNGFAFSQASSNTVAFLIAVSFSFWANARYNFNSQLTGRKYLLFVIFMGLMSLSIGYMSDKLALNSFVTLVIFSAVSLTLGFLYSKLVIFRENNS